MGASAKPLGHIVLVGTSTLRNALAKRGLLQSVDLGGLGIDEVAGFLEKCVSDSSECGGGRAYEALRVVSRLVLSYPYEMSAELNGMKPWLEALKGGYRGAVGKVVLLETDTISGNASGSILEGVFSEYGVEVERATVVRLGVPGYFVEGIRNLKSSIVGYAKMLEGEGYCPLINLTGGFKPESAIALASSIGRIPLAYYIHESFRDTIYIPLYPLADPRTARDSISEAGYRGRWAEFRDPPEWLKHLACTLAPVKKARITGESILLSVDMLETLKALIE